MRLALTPHDERAKARAGAKSFAASSYIAREVFRTLTRPEAIPVGADLHDARVTAGFNLNEVAAVLRVDPTRVSRLERALDFDRDLADRYAAWLTAQNAA
jgi:hypothetical protein